MASGIDDSSNATGADSRALGRRGFGVLGSLAPELIRTLAKAAEDAGYQTFWVNDGPGGEGLAALAEAATVTSSIRLAVGAIPLDRVDANQIAMRVNELGLPVERLIVGVGAGGAAGGLGRVRFGISELRERTSATLVVAAMGPKMCSLAGEVADGVLLDWATPSYASGVRDLVGDRAAEVGRPCPWVASYVFTALGTAASKELHAETAYYAAIPSYAAHFARMNAGPLDATATGNGPAALRRALTPFDEAMDEPVVRAVVATEAVGEYLALLEAAAPAS